MHWVQTCHRFSFFQQMSEHGVPLKIVVIRIRVGGLSKRTFTFTLVKQFIAKSISLSENLDI